MSKKDSCPCCIFLVIVVGVMACLFLKGMDDRLDQIDKVRCAAAATIARK